LKSSFTKIKFLFDFLTYFESILKDSHIYETIQIEECAEFTFPKPRANSSKWHMCPLRVSWNVSLLVLVIWILK